MVRAIELVQERQRAIKNRAVRHGRPRALELVKPPRGNLIYQSSLPEGADYYFIIDDDGIVQLSRSERILYMRKVSRS
jgi:hypothetical protein